MYCTSSLFTSHSIYQSFYLPGQRNWKPSLKASTVREMPAFKALLKEADTYVCVVNSVCPVPKQYLFPPLQSKNLPTLKQGIPCYGAPAPSSPAPNTSPSAPPPSSSHLASRTPADPPHGANLGAANFSPTFPQRRGTYSNTRPATSAPQDSTGGLFSVAGQSSSVRGSTSVDNRGVGRPTMKRCRPTKGDDVEDVSSPFSTAKDEYVSDGCVFLISNCFSVYCCRPGNSSVDMLVEGVGPVTMDPQRKCLEQGIVI